jgi:hypothetical protein
VKKEDPSGTTLLTTTLYVNGLYEVELTEATLYKKYYYAGSQLVALRDCDASTSFCGGAVYLHTNHLGSSSTTTDYTGADWGAEVRCLWQGAEHQREPGRQPGVHRAVFGCGHGRADVLQRKILRTRRV